MLNVAYRRVQYLVHSFLIYINDLCNVSKVLDFILFADDTNIFFSHKDPIFLMELVNTELQKLSCWFQANKLSINVKKSNYIIFKTSQNRQKLDKFRLFNYWVASMANPVGVCV